MKTGGWLWTVHIHTFLFWLNEYVDMEYVVIPYKNAKIELGEDDLVLFHLQAWINVECALGMLVHHWDILRRPILSRIGLQRTTALVMALCCLDNYCLNQNIAPSDPLDDVLHQKERLHLWVMQQDLVQPRPHGW